MTNKVFEENGNDNNGALDQQPKYLFLGKKYANEAELDKAYGHLNDHAGQLEEENKTLREQLEALAGKEDAVTKVLEALKPNTQVKPDAEDLDKGTNGVNKEELESLVRSLLSQEKQQTQEERNVKQVNDALTKLYGEKAAEVYNKRANDLGIDLDALSAKSPAAVLELFKAQGTNQHQQMPPSSVNTNSLNGPAHGTHEYWERLYKDGKITRERKFREQHKSLTVLGREKYWSKN